MGKLIAKVSKSDGGSLTVKMSNFTVTFDKKKISLKFLPVNGNAENRHGCQFSNVTSDMGVEK